MGKPGRASLGVVGRLLERARFEIVPTSGVERELPHLPAGVTVAVTCSPRRGIDATLALAERLRERGVCAVPHISARLVASRPQVAGILRRLSDQGIREIFVVGGDVPEPSGPFPSATRLLETMAEIGHDLQGIGVADYPEPHPLIDGEVLLAALLEKQRFATYMVTQICFDPDAVVRRLSVIRDLGIRLPAYVGVPGAVKRRKLLEISLRVGVGDSVRYLTKHRSLLARLLRGGSYRPDAIVARLAPMLVQADVGILGLHLNTFNQVESTERWRREVLGAYGHVSQPLWEERGREDHTAS